MYLHDHLEKLRYFFEVARLGSLKKASDSVFITQPSLTKSIKSLEEVIGRQLFIRKPRGVELTKEGKILFQFCHQLFAMVKDVEQQLSFPDDPLAGSLRVGTYNSIGIYFWPSFLKTFLPKYPQIDFELTTGRSLDMQKKLEAGELDLILVIEPKKSAQIEIETLKKDSFRLYETTKAKKVYDNQKDTPLIVMPDAVTGNSTVKDSLSKEQIADRKVYLNSSLESVKELTLNGIGQGLLPQFVAKELVSKKKLKEVKQAPFKKGIGHHTVGLAYQSARKDSPLIKTLIDELKSYDWN
jgi:DNA-binding transcriptional LysR family regulator